MGDRDGCKESERVMGFRAICVTWWFIIFKQTYLIHIWEPTTTLTLSGLENNGHERIFYSPQNLSLTNRYNSKSYLGHTFLGGCFTSHLRIQSAYFKPHRLYVCKPLVDTYQTMMGRDIEISVKRTPFFLNPIWIICRYVFKSYFHNL